jgi:ribosome maturation factor RimP
MAWQNSVEQTVVGLGYDLVEIERSAGGLLRITIDMPYTAGQAQQFVTVEDCEVVTRQLQYLLEVEQVDYTRLEVGSPGIDRPLRHAADFARFVGETVDITLKQPIGVTGSDVAANRKKFRGTLEAAETEGHWQVVWSDAPAPKPGQRVSKKRAPAPLQALQFTLDDIREARLAPVVDFKGRKSAPVPPADNSAQ